MANTSKFNILYLMNVDWNWIKQRPHFLAEKLSINSNVTILYPYNWRRQTLTKNNKKNLNLIPIFFIPFGGKLKLIKKINNLYLKSIIKFLSITKDFNFFWVSTPDFVGGIPKIKAKIIYDLMDDILAFEENINKKSSLFQSEKTLIELSEYIFCSSRNLYYKKINDYGHHEKFSIIFNALELDSASKLNIVPKLKQSNLYRLCYIGTISSWFDLEALEAIILNTSNIEIYIIGPIIKFSTSIYNNEKIRFLGPINHENLFTVIDDYDGFIMPFKKCELINSVDPVKIYEYIYLNKPIISIYYDELEKFREFVHFYDNYIQLVTIVKDLVNSKFSMKYSFSQREKFLFENNWNSRIIKINQILKIT